MGNTFKNKMDEIGSIEILNNLNITQELYKDASGRVSNHNSTSRFNLKLDSIKQGH